MTAPVLERIRRLVEQGRLLSLNEGAWLLSKLEAADTETAALIRDIESYVSISSEQAGIITRLRSALELANAENDTLRKNANG